MPSFYSAERNYVVSTSLKVMFTTLTRQASLQPLRNDLHAALRVWLTPGVRRFLLVRNPYDRLVSFYADKLQAADSERDGATGQHCQRILLPALGLSGGEGAVSIAARLRAVTFDDFVAALPHVFRDDPHLWPQWWSRSFRVRGLALPAPLHLVLKIEDSATMARELGIDLSIRANATPHDAADRYFAAPSYAVVNDVYRGDFAAFSYPQRLYRASS